MIVRIDEPHRAGLEQRVAGPFGDLGGDRRIVAVEAMVPHEDVEAGGVAAAHLHAVDRRERLLDGQVAGSCRDAGVAAGQRIDLAGGAQTVAADRPQTVAEADRHGARPLERVGVEAGGTGEAGLDFCGVAVELVEAGADGSDELVAVGEGEHARQAVQRDIDSGHRVGDRGRVTDEVEGAVQPADDRPASGSGRVGRRLTMAMIPHMHKEATPSPATRFRPWWRHNRGTGRRTSMACGAAGLV